MHHLPNIFDNMPRPRAVIENELENIDQRPCEKYYDLKNVNNCLIFLENSLINKM